VNPSAGKGYAKKILPQVTSALASGAATVKLQVVETSSYEDARFHCNQAVAMGADSLIVMGGDGMMHLGLNAVAETGVALGVIPAGRGNDFARGVGVPISALQAVKLIAAGHTEDVDLMKIEGHLAGGAQTRYVGSILSTGFDARVNDRVNRMKINLGQLSYTWAALAELSIFEPLKYRLVIDGEELNQTAMFIAVGNAGYFGGGMQGLPKASITDGLLDVTIINPVSRLTLLRLLPRMFGGSYIKDPAVELRTAKEVIVDGDGLLPMGDGEYMGQVPMRCTVVPGALKLYRAAK
jgi:diacylglycerol kinase (ATP)